MGREVWKEVGWGEVWERKGKTVMLQVILVVQTMCTLLGFSSWGRQSTSGKQNLQVLDKKTRRQPPWPGLCCFVNCLSRLH